MPWLRRLVADLSLRIPEIDSRMCGGHCGTGTDISQGAAVFPCQCHSTKATHPSSSTCCSYQKDKRRMLGNLQKSDASTG